MVNVDKNNLPEYCYSILHTTGEVIMIHRYQDGYSPTREDNLPWYGQENADAANEKIGVSKDQELAMSHGSMFGWGSIAAKPETWELNPELKLMLSKEELKDILDKIDEDEAEDHYTKYVNFQENYVKENFPEGWEIVRSGGMLWSIGGDIVFPDDKKVFIVFTSERKAFATFNDNKTLYLTREEVSKQEEDLYDNDALLIKQVKQDENDSETLVAYWESLLSEKEMLIVVKYFNMFLKMIDTDID